MRAIKIFRESKNAFGEPKERQYVCTVQGYYHEDKNDISFNMVESKILAPDYIEKLLVAYNEDSLKIKESDYFYYNNVKYQIIDKGNIQNIVFDMIIDRK